MPASPATAWQKYLDVLLPCPEGSWAVLLLLFHPNGCSENTAAWDESQNSFLADAMLCLPPHRLDPAAGRSCVASICMERNSPSDLYD